MTFLRCVLAVVTSAAVTTTAALLGWPGWSFAPMAVLLLVAAAYLVAARRSERADRPPGRVDGAMAVLAAALAIATGLTALIGTQDPAAADRAHASVTTTASDTVRMLFTFTADDFTADAAQRRQAALAPRLTGRLLADYRSQGPNVVLPSAVETRAAVTTTVQAIGVGDSSPDTVRLLVFATEEITVPSATPATSTVPIVRWAVMRRVENTWRLADIYPAGIGG